jgi:HSP90 family molecular chaperone
MTGGEEQEAGHAAGVGARYTMTVDLSVLESLGINLYSNAAAVLSELVANAYDADATLVKM